MLMMSKRPVDGSSSTAQPDTPEYVAFAVVTLAFVLAMPTGLGRGGTWAGRFGLERQRRTQVAAALKRARTYLLDLIEGGMYTMIYAAMAISLSPLAELPFPAYIESTPWHICLLEVILQAGVNQMVQIAIRDYANTVLSPYLPDLGTQGDRSGARAGGGVVMTTCLFSRQGAWKRKMALLDRHLDQHFFICFPKTVLAALGLW